MRRVSTALALVVAFMLPGSLLGAVPAAAQEESSAVTLPGTGEFAGLRVTVAQTRDLIDQVVRVSWTGGPPTKFVSGQVAANFLEIMQCWGDESSGPDRTQCENLEGLRTINQRAPGELPPAPELDPQKPNSQDLPFRAVGTPAPTTLAVGRGNPYFDEQITNEVHRAIIRADGTGEVNFEMQSAAQSAGLGCGRPDAATGVIAPCWLVVMHVGDRQPDGTPRTDLQSLGGGLDPRAWENRIEFRLDFASLAATCAFGVERSITGHEMVTDAVARWQRVLCREGQNPFSFTRTTDQLVRAQATSLDPDLGIVNEPVPPDQAPPGRPLVYAPVAVNALTIAFNIDAAPNLALLPPDDPRRDLAGLPLTDITLNARLVAKLLTQSYRFTVAGEGRAVAAGNPLVPPRDARLQDNPQNLFFDPEFLELNPELTDLLPGTPVNPLVQIGSSDLTGLLWDWVLADPDARAWIDGATDAGVGDEAARRKMVINPANRGLRSPTDLYPRNDLLCWPVEPPSSLTVRTTVCPLDIWPSTDDMSASGRNAIRGDSLRRSEAIDVEAYQRNPVPIQFVRDPRQRANEQAVMAVVDAATADRYRLPTVKLVNAAGEAVAPDAAGLAAAVSAMRPSSTDGVLVPDPASTNPAAYPLTAVSYAVTAPTTFEDPQAAPDYARFLRYAVGPGQTPGERPGQLPFGYLPLPQEMRDQTLAAADTIVRLAAGEAATQPAGPSGGSPAGPLATGTPGGGAGLRPPSTAGGSNSAPAGTATTTGSDLAAGDAAAPGADTAAPPDAASAAALAAQSTPALAMPGNVGFVLVGLFVVGGLAAAFAPATHLLGRRTVASRGGVSS